MKIEEKKEPNPTTYEYLIGMIEGCMPNDNDVVTTEKLLDKLIKEYAQQYTLDREKVIDVEIEDIYRRIRGPIHYTTNKDTGVVIHGIARATKDIYDFICSLPVKQQDYKKRYEDIVHSEWFQKAHKDGIIEFTLLDDTESYQTDGTVVNQPQQQQEVTEEEIIVKKNKNGFITITFPENTIPFMQDHGFWRNVPSDVEFVVRSQTVQDHLDLVAEGYGALHNNEFGLKYNYGNGAIYVSLNDLPDSVAKTIKALLTNKEKQT